MDSPHHLPPQRYAVPLRDRGVRLDLFLKERIPRMSRAKVQKAISVRVEIERRLGQPRPSSRLMPGDVVVVYSPWLDETPQPVPIPVLHRDEHLLVVDKPAGLICHPNNRTRVNSLLLMARIEESDPGLALAHRLDRETTGVLVLTRTLAAARALAHLFHDRLVEKTYLAVVHGTPPVDQFTIDLPLGRARRTRIFVKQGVDSQAGKSARTRFRVLRRAGPVSLVEACPETGRRHQIRVHLAEAGFPVVGDKLYGADERFYLHSIHGRFDGDMASRLGAGRQLLHAVGIALPHPLDGHLLRVAAPVPADMQAALR